MNYVEKTQSALGEAVKASPPVAITTITYIGLSLQEWVYVATLCYTTIQIYLLIRDKIIRKRRRNEV